MRRKTGTATNSRLWNWLAVPGLPAADTPPVARAGIRLSHSVTFGSMNRLVWAALACAAVAFGQSGETAADLAAGYLRELIRFDTTNPPGNETRVARYLKQVADRDRKSTRLNSSHLVISYAVFCL